MVLCSTVMSNNSVQEIEVDNSPPLVVNTNNFKDQDLEDFVNISEEIARTTRERRSRGRRNRSCSKTLVATMTREEIFESTNVDDDRFLTAMEHDTTYDTEKSREALVNSIENLMKYFDENVNVKDDSSAKSSPAKKLSKGKVAAAVASFRYKCSRASSPSGKTRTQKPKVKNHIQDLKKFYDVTVETETRSAAKPVKTKSPKLFRKTQVKQIASLFNNKINSMVKSPSPDLKTPEVISPSIKSITSPTFTSTPKSKSPKLKTKFPSFLTKLRSPKCSPFSKRKQLQKSPSVSSLVHAASPVTKRKQLQKERSTTCIVAESVFSQLSVKDKVLLYNKFIADMSKQNPDFSKHAEILKSNVKTEMQRGEVIFEKQDSVKHLRDSFEAKTTHAKSLSKTLGRFKRSSIKLSLDITPKAKEYEDILQIDNSKSRLEDGSQNHLHVSTLTVVLKSSPESKKLLEGKTKKQHKGKKDVSFLEDIGFIGPSFKRTQSMIRSSVCVEPLAPPRKIRRTQHECLAPKQFFQNRHLEELFYQWLREKNGVAFEIAPINNINEVIEIAPKQPPDNVSPHKQVNQKDFAKATKTDDVIVLIKNTIDNERDFQKSVIEIELPLEVEIPSAETNETETEYNDLGLTRIIKTTSEDSQMEFQAHKVSTLLTKSFRKKKLRRFLTLRKENSVVESNTIISTDSDSDFKTQNMKIQSSTLPKTKKCSNCVKNATSFPKPVNHLYDEISTSELDRSLIWQMNSPSKIKKAYTLTVISSPSPYSESDFYDSQRTNTPIKEISRSWPSLLEAGLDWDTKLFKYKTVSTEFINMAKIELEEEQQKQLMDSFIDQGFETGSNDVDSPLRLARKAVPDFNKPFAKWNNSTNLSTLSSVQEVFYARPAIVQSDDMISPMPYKSSPRDPASLPMTINNEDLNAENSEGSHNPLSGHLSGHVSPSSQDVINSHLSPDSQFWISAGNFTAAITIQHYDYERLLLLRNIYALNCLETKEMNFGIDDQKFCLDNSATSDEIFKKVSIENNCSQYWFATGDVLIPFRGQKITTKKIQSFFNYIREFEENNGPIRFGVDGCEFSNIYQQTQIISPIKTSDLDQSDTESEVYEPYSQSSAQNIKDVAHNLSKSPNNDYNEQTFETEEHVLNSVNATIGSEELLEGNESLDFMTGLSTSTKATMALNLPKCKTDKQTLESEEHTFNCTNDTSAQKLVGRDQSSDNMPELCYTIRAIMLLNHSKCQTDKEFLETEEQILNCKNTKSFQKLIESNESHDDIPELSNTIKAIMVLNLSKRQTDKQNLVLEEGKLNSENITSSQKLIEHDKSTGEMAKLDTTIKTAMVPTLSKCQSDKQILEPNATSIEDFQKLVDISNSADADADADDMPDASTITKATMVLNRSICQTDEQTLEPEERTNITTSQRLLKNYGTFDDVHKLSIAKKTTMKSNLLNCPANKETSKSEKRKIATSSPMKTGPGCLVH